MATEELVAAILSLAQDVEDADRALTADDIDRVRTLSDRVEELSSLTGLDFTEVQQKLMQVLGSSRPVGRPRIHIPVEALEGCMSLGLRINDMAAMFGVHRQTILRRMAQNNISVSSQYSEISDAQLDTLVLELHRSHPKTGYRMMRAFLRTGGHLVQMKRVRQSLRRVDPEGTELRALANRALHRRQYSVPAANCLWHIDGNHKLIRWRLVIHGGIDGFSRLIVYLNVSTNNRADTVLQAFRFAVTQYGFPSRVRSDKGGENIGVATLMVETQGENRNSHITGRSVHNQRIERLWRDVYTQVIDLFHTLFHEMEAVHMLAPDNEVHLYALHWVFLPLIQSHLQRFKEAWNLHNLRTEHSQSPYQLWLRSRNPQDSPEQVGDLYGATMDGPEQQELEVVQVPEVQLPRDLTHEELHRLPQATVTLDEALDVYRSTVHELEHIFM